jgi:phosphoribosyl 1,2-cyclic phosphate phosphodiesterase
MHATLTVLGSGTSMGVPTIGCDCAVCHSSDPRDRRTRPSVLISYNGRHVMIDSTPDFREQALRENITQLDAVLYTHTHADHILGIDDLRPLTYHHKPGKMPLYAAASAATFCAGCSPTFLKPTYKFGGLPQVELHPIDGPVELFGARFEPLTVIHGETPILGFVSDRLRILTDHSGSGGDAGKVAGSRHLVSGRAALHAASDALDGRAVAEDRGRGEAEARDLYAHLSRPAARGDERGVAGRSATWRLTG